MKQSNRKCFFFLLCKKPTASFFTVFCFLTINRGVRRTQCSPKRASNSTKSQLTQNITRLSPTIFNAHSTFFLSIPNPTQPHSQPPPFQDLIKKNKKKKLKEIKTEIEEPCVRNYFCTLNKNKFKFKIKWKKPMRVVRVRNRKHTICWRHITAVRPTRPICRIVAYLSRPMFCCVVLCFRCSPQKFSPKINTT